MLTITLALIVLATVAAILALRHKAPSPVIVTPITPRTASLSASVIVSGTIQATHPLNAPTPLYASAYEAEFRALEDRLTRLGA